MKKYITTFIFVAPTILLICLVLLRKHNGNGLTDSVGVMKIGGDSLRNSAAVWTNRPFTSAMTGAGAFREELLNQIRALQLSDKENSNALWSCLGIINAYGTGNWDTFISIRIPLTNYLVRHEAIGKNGLDISSIDNPKVYHAYQALWQKTFKDSPLFSEISLVSNSVTLFIMPVNETRQIATPVFKTKNYQRWFEYTPTQVYYYTNIIALSDPKIIRLFFFTKDHQQPGFIKVLFVLDEGTETWLPWQLTFGFVQMPPAHNLDFF